MRTFKGPISSSQPWAGLHVPLMLDELEKQDRKSTLGPQNASTLGIFSMRRSMDWVGQYSPMTLAKLSYLSRSCA